MQIPWKKIRLVLTLVLCALGVIGIVFAYAFEDREMADEKLYWWYFFTFYFPLEPLLLFCTWAEDKFKEEDADDVRKNEQSGRK